MASDQTEGQPGPEGPKGNSIRYKGKEGVFDLHKESKLTSPHCLAHSSQGGFCA